MNRRTRIVTVICLVAIGAAWLVWRHGSSKPAASELASSASPSPSRQAQNQGPATNAPAAPAVSSKVAAPNTNKFAYRLSNTTNSIHKLEANPHAILLANAFIDTDKPLDLKIPSHLRSAGDPGAYIVQARGPTDARFRAALVAAGAEIVSYIPNNAYLVILSANGAGALSGISSIQSVLPYEPYYKIQSTLLGLAVNELPLPPGTALNLGVFAADAAQADQVIEDLGGKVIGHDRSAFGPVVRVLAPTDWTKLAQSVIVQSVEVAHSHKLANDLSRVTMGISPDTVSGMTSDYMGLSGANVLVAVNDTGIDATHPDFTANGNAATGPSGLTRIFGLDPIDLVDTNGHGTHVAGIIAGNGAESLGATGPLGPGPDVGTFAEGSVPHADFRGKAPLANLFSLGYNNSDYELQTNAAIINALISNNSWDYGNGDQEYDLAAASYDAATRDALPFTTGSQPVLFVFAAGNDGGGDDSGTQGSADTITSPGTAKNVITVGALEQFRNITNIVTTVTTNGSGGFSTNTVEYWLLKTDSANQVAWYSSRGNVGIGTEGTYGRFKPDLVAPGTFVVSTRSSQWDTNAYYNPTNVLVSDYLNQVVDSTNWAYYNVAVPPTAVAVSISIVPNTLSPNPFPANLLIYAKQSSFPTTNNFDILSTNDALNIPPDSGGAITGIQALLGNGFSFAVADSTNIVVHYDLIVEVFTTNNVGDLYRVLQGMNEQLAPYYRYESGTSMAAAGVSGLLALIDDYFTNSLTLIPSPALMKAVLINGTRSVGDYNVSITNGINFQGWGLGNIEDCIPPGGLTEQFNQPSSSFFVEQNPTNGLATGDSHTYIVTLDPATYSQYLPLQATLVWTDPPGDPAAAIKLVNNLDLIITNLDTGDVYFGNDISPDIGFNEPWATNGPPNLDTINNVESIFLQPMLAGSYSVTVVGRSVNVNAVTAQTNNAAGQYAPNVVQDFALVISTGDMSFGQVSNSFTVTDSGIASNPTGDQNFTVVTTTNAPLFDQIAGASSPLMGTNTLPLGTQTIWGPNGVVTIGQTNQWHFYLVTNTGPAADFTNAAFITFQASTLSIPRMGVLDPLGMPDATRPEADIDLFVSQDPSLTNLSPVAIANCLAGTSAVGFGVQDGGAAVTQGGTEYVFFTNSAPGQVYYVGVQSEDREGAEYAFLPVFTDVPFSSLDQNGNQIVHGFVIPQRIPDGDNAHPGVTNCFALAVLPMEVEKVAVTNLDEHQNFGDLFGQLSFSGKHVILNNHDGFGNTFGRRPIVYDDSRNRPLGTTNTDGPGTLVDFRTKSALGPWILGVQDNALTHTGQVSRFDLLIQPHRNLKEPGVIVSVPPGGWFVDYVTVPAGYTNLTFFATNVTLPTPGTPPIQMYEKLGNDPTLTDYDQEATLTNGSPPGNSISIGPPLDQGQYFIGLYNPNTTLSQNVFISARLGINKSVNDVYTYNTNSTALLDDAVVNSSLFVTATQAVASVSVGMVVNSARISDLTFTLVSPTGQRVLLMENRGGGSTNIGFLNVYTNFFGTASSGGAGGNTNVIGPIKNTGILIVDYDFFALPDNLDVFYDGSNIFHSGLTSFAGTFTIPYGPGLATNIVIVMDGPGSGVLDPTSLWTYTPRVVQEDFNYLTFTDDTNLAQVPIKFANPPYSINDPGTNYLFSDFELATNGDYFGPTNIYDAYGGWTVPTNLVTISTIVTNGQFVQVTNVVILSNNLVSVADDPRTAQGGSNYLALGSGTITRTLPLTVGRKYQVTYAYRGPGIGGWWRGEGNATDSSDPENNGNNGALVGRFNFPAGVVAQAFQFEDPGNTYQFAGTNTYIQVPASATLNVGTNGGFTVEGWINPTNLSRPEPLVEWLAHVPTNSADTNLVIVQGPVLDPGTGHYYYLLAATNWTVSESWAQQLGGHLVTVDTANEENWVYDTFTIYGTRNRDLWTGLGYTNSTGKFGWSDGSTNLNYANWAPAQPSVCGAKDQYYVAIMGPTNANPGLWQLEDNLGLTCDNPPTNPIYGVVEVSNIPTNGVQFWISGTNWTPGETNVLQGCLYANIVDTNFISHEIFSAPGLLTSNIYQHVALTYNTNTGVAALYLNGTNVATANLGVFVPKTDGDLLIGWDMSRYTNNFYGGEMDEMSIYSRALSLAEISSIYNISVPPTNGFINTNGLIGKFDPSIMPPLSLAKFAASFGSDTSILYADNSRWLSGGFTFTADTNSMPIQFTGLEPGVLLDSFSINEFQLGNVYYLPEQALAALNGSSAYGDWTLQVWDNRAGAYLTNLSQIVTWQISFTLVSNAVVAASLPPQTPVVSTVPAGQITYYSVTVPAWAHVATNILVSSDQPVNLYFNQTNPPNGSNPNDYPLLTSATSGYGAPSLVTNAAVPFVDLLPLLTNQTYYLGVQNLGNHSATVTLEVDYDILALTNGVPFTSTLNTNEYDSVRYFSFDVSSNVYEATFQLLQLSGNADLVIRKGVPLPDLTSSDYGSFSAQTAAENIYVLTNSSPVQVSPGRWYLGVFKRDPGFINYSVLAKELVTTNGSFTNSYGIIDLTNGVPFNWNAGPGAALTNFFHFHPTNSVIAGVTNYIQSLRFELYNLTGNGDLTVQTNMPPLAPPFFQTSQNGGNEPELIFINTNNVQTNLATDWYLGVPNLEVTNISFSIVAVIQTNGYFPAFPGATGAGGGAVGAGHAGASSTVYHVTTTADSGPSSLRDAVSTTNRTVVFDIAGNIYLLSPLIITNSNLTIAGQTSPGGITVAGDTMTVTNAHEVVIRDLRFRSLGATIFTNSVVTNWSNGIEGSGSPATVFTPNNFAGWHVDFGSVDWLARSQGWNTYEGNFCIDLDGNGPGGVSTNVPTVAGTNYVLTFAYCKNPNAAAPTAQVLINGNPLGTLAPTIANSIGNLHWQTTSMVFTATSPSTLLAFHSLDVAGVSGVFLDAISLTTNALVPIGVSAVADSLRFLNASNIIADHVSASWSTNNLVSLLNSSNVTVQWSIMADSLYSTNNPPSVGSFLRYGGGMLSLNHNLYADNYSGSPRLGDNLTLDFVNNVIYNWGVRSGLSGGTNDLSDFSTNGCTNQLNYVCNYLIAGPDTAIFSTNNFNITNIAFFGGVTNALAATWIFQTNNFIDSDTNGVLNGSDTGWGMFTNDYTRFGRAFNPSLAPVDEAYQAYEKVLDFAGVNMGLRDSVDTSIVSGTRTQTGRIISSGGALPVLTSALPYLDTDQDGLPDFWEYTFTPGLVFVPSNNNDRDGDGYSDLEEYNNWLAVPHALTVTNTPVGVDLYQLCGESGHLAFFLTNSIHGFVYLTNVIGSVTNTGPWSNSIAVFTPTNSTAGGTNYYGYASFGFYVTNLDTSAYIGPVPVSVIVSAVPIQINSNMPPIITPLVSGVSDPTNYGGSDYYSIVVTSNDFGALFELDNPTGPMALVISHNNPYPSLSGNDYYTNRPPSPGNLEIAVLTNSMPVPLQPGTWYMAAVNEAGVGSNVVYTAKVTLLHGILPPQFGYPTNGMTTNILETVPWAVSCVATDLDTPPLPLSFAVSGPTGLIVSNGVIYWTPTEAQGPSTNPVAVSVSNGAFTVTNTFTIIVEESNLPPVLPFIPNQIAIIPGTLVVTNTATDPDIPTNALGYMLYSTVPGTNQPVIDTNGVITWTPLATQSNTNFLFTTVVTDTNPWAVNAQSFSVSNTFTVYTLPGLPPGTPITNIVEPHSTNWYAIQVPTNAIFATNQLLFATLPVNLWFSTNLPPSLDYELLTLSTGGISVLSTNRATAPTNIVQGGIYYLGVQNPNSVAVTNALRVDFAFVSPPGLSLPFIPDQYIAAGDTLVVDDAATDTNASAVLVYNLLNPPAGAVIDSSGTITWVTTTNMPVPTNVLFTATVTDTGANLSATNSFHVIVLPGLIDDQPQTNIVGPNGINWFLVHVPVNADIATNFLLFATAPVNFWYSTNQTITSPTDVEFLTNSTGGSRVIDTTSTPRLVPGSRYFLGVQNPNSFAVTNAVKVKFHLLPPPVIFSITETNIGGSNGFLITWFAPTNNQFHLQWTPTLVPSHWANFNGVISDASTASPTTGMFQFFDDGSQTGGFGPTRFYRLLLLASPTNTAPFFVNMPGVLYANPAVPFVYTNAARDWDVPAQTLVYSVTDTLAGTNVAINPLTGVITWTPDASLIGLTNWVTTTVLDNGVPGKSATNLFAVVVTTNSAVMPAFKSVAIVASGVKFQWVAPTNEQFQVGWTTNLTPPNWHVFPPIISSTNGSFSFVDTNMPLLWMKFYELILLP